MLKTVLFLSFASCALVGACVTNAGESLTIHVTGNSDRLLLGGPEGGGQIVVSLSDSAINRDVTRQVAYRVEPVGIVVVSPTGFVTPLVEGEATIFAEIGQSTANIQVGVTGITTPKPLSFPNDIVPRLTQAGCNSGSCHGTPSGKNNFRLSLLGFEPESDHRFLTRESRGRRMLPNLPERSLLMLKATGQIAHGGGARIDSHGDAFAVLRRWIAEGMQYRPANDPTVVRIDAFPIDQIVAKQSGQQLQVTAHFDDGTSRDITRVAEYKSNQVDLCKVDHDGWVQFSERTGTAAVMIRFQDHVAVFMATVPLGQQVTELPAERNLIDKYVFQKLIKLGLPPSKVCDDVTFIRRVYLDLAGRLPTLAESREFMTDLDLEKRKHWIDRLVDDPCYAELFASKWSAMLRNKAEGGLEQVSRETHAFHTWIREHFDRNTPFNEFATELITARGKPGTNPAVSWYRVVTDPKAQMADIAQVFLGVRIQCAQCHHHPYEKWTQDDFYGFTAFFSTIGRKSIRKLPEETVVYHRRETASAKNPNTNRELRPTPLDELPLEIDPTEDPRVKLASWLSSPNNPFFAKVLVNRYWKHFFGRGLVEPEDDLRVTNPPTNPALLAALAQSFVDSNFNLKQLCRTICDSSTYQLSSIPNEFNGDDDQNYARYFPRRLPAEVLLDAMNDAAEAKNNFNHQPAGVRAIALPDDSFNAESLFLRVFGRPQMDTAFECERSMNADLSQSLHLLNSNAMEQIIRVNNGRAMRLARDKTLDDDAKLNEMYMVALSRLPHAEEISIAKAHLAKKREQSVSNPSKLSADQAEREAFEDILWVLVNTKEFLFNH